jgi:putative acetyltransferase
MAVHVQLERADQPEIIALVDALDAYQKVLYPPESHHGIDINELIKPNVLFAVARDARVAVGCGAVVLKADYGELKRMYVSREHRGAGVGRALLQFLEAQAVNRRVSVLRLETGVSQLEALRLYEKAGYEQRPPFDTYSSDPFSVFMEKRLVAGHT